MHGFDPSLTDDNPHGPLKCPYSEWDTAQNASIMCAKCCTTYIQDLRKGNPKPKVIMASCPADPIHPGHISSLQDARRRVAQVLAGVCDSCICGKDGQIYPKVKASRCVDDARTAILIVVVNGREFLERKKGVAFMPLKVRSQIVSALRGVDVVVPFNPSNYSDMTVSEAIGMINPDFFAKGGDRDVSNIPEVEVCAAHDITIVPRCGDEKYWSSSSFLKEHSRWTLKEYWRKQHHGG